MVHNSSPDTFEIAPAKPENLTEVLSLVFCKCEAQDALNRVRATLTEYREGRVHLRGLLGAYRTGRLVGAAFAQVLPGRSATFWPPQLEPGEPEETAEELAARAMAHACQAGAVVVHALLDGQPNRCDITRLESAGFTRLAELYYLLAEERDFPTTPPAGPLTFEPYSSEMHSRLCRVVAETYQATLDCPGLDGIRSAHDVLEGYAANPGSCPSHWFLIQHEDRDVGCLLLADYEEHGNCELTYMGLTPSARGNRWGVQITRYAQWVARSLGRQRVVLAVDAANQPARNMYAAAGFRGWDRRQVYMRTLEP